MTESENENDHLDHDHFDHTKGQTLCVVFTHFT